MNDEMIRDLVGALIVAADSMRRCDPVYCSAMNLEQITDAEWDDTLAIVEDVLKAVQERVA